MSARDEIIALLLGLVQKYKDIPEAHDALMEAVKEAKAVGCGTCIWYREGTCTEDAMQTKTTPYHICKKYERDLWDGSDTEETG